MKKWPNKKYEFEAAVINRETYICVMMGSTADNRSTDSITICEKIKAH